MAMSATTLLALLRLSRTPGLGPLGVTKLIDRYGSPEDAVESLSTVGAGAIRLAAPAAIAEEIEQTYAAGGRFLCRGDADFPRQIATAEGTPWVLVVKGDRSLLATRFVGIVGARNASAGGRKIARDMAAGLAGVGLGVASGLARGIDTAAHEGALVHGVTAAVIATGIDVVYPPENAELMAAIGDNGLIVTERPLGAGPQASQFPRRNRLISALSEAVIVVEAAPMSGSLITARLALEQGREVMAVPGSPLDERHRGTNRLLKEGAHLVESADDVLAALAPFEVKPKAAPAPRRRAPPRPQPASAASRGTAAEPLAARLRECLAVEPVAVDELIRQCHASAAEVQKALLELELAGEIERHAGNRVSLAVF